MLDLLIKGGTVVDGSGGLRSASRQHGSAKKGGEQLTGGVRHRGAPWLFWNLPEPFLIEEGTASRAKRLGPRMRQAPLPRRSSISPMSTRARGPTRPRR